MKIKKEPGLAELVENAVRYREEEGDLNWYEWKAATHGIPLTICILLTVYFSNTQPLLMKVFLIIAAVLLFIYSLIKIKRLKDNPTKRNIQFIKNAGVSVLIIIATVALAVLTFFLVRDYL